MSVSIEEFQKDMNKYFALLAKEDVYITKDSEVIAKLSMPYADADTYAASFRGVIPKSFSVEKALSERGRGL